MTTYERVVAPATESYRGKVFMLVGGENSSASFQFAWLAQKAGVATLVGQATGGNLRGPSGSELTWVTLPNSGVAVDIPLLASRYQFDTPDASVTPEVLVKQLGTVCETLAGNIVKALDGIAKGVAAS